MKIIARCRVRTLLLILLIVTCVPKELVAQSSSKFLATYADLQEIIATGMRHHFDELNIKADFVFKRGWARTKEEGLAGVFFNPISGEPSTTEIASGHIVKLGKSLRYRIDFECPSDYDPHRQTSSLISDEVIVHGPWLVRRIPAQENRDGIVFGNTTTIQHRTLNLDLQELKHQSPFTKFCSILAPLMVSHVTRKSEEKLTALASSENEKVTLRLFDSNERQIETATLSTGGRFPTLLTSTGSNWHGEYQQIMSLPSGAEFATIYRHLLGPVRVANYDDSLYILHSWEAKNVSQDVSPDDFQIHLNSAEQFAGLPRPINDVVDMFSLSNDSPTKESSLLVESSQNSSSYLINFWSVVGISMLVILFGLYLRRFKASCGTPLLLFFLLCGCQRQEQILQNEFVSKEFRDNGVVDTRTATASGNETFYHFGQIFPRHNLPEDRQLKTSFFLTNDQELEMKMAIRGSTCGCINASLASSILRDEEQTELQVSFYPSFQVGLQTQSVTIDFSTTKDRFQREFVVSAEVYPRLFFPGATSTVQLLGEDGTLQFELVSFAPRPFKNDLQFLRYDSRKLDINWQLIASEAWGSVYCRRWNVEIRKLESFDNGVTELACFANDSECMLKIRDSYKAFDISHEHVFFVQICTTAR